MNEKLKELEKQCWSHYIDGVLIDGHLHFDTKKFAELIVRECADIASINAHQYQPPGDFVLKHFGVEE
jgi:hypothetical protein